MRVLAGVSILLFAVSFSRFQADAQKSPDPQTRGRTPSARNGSNSSQRRSTEKPSGGDVTAKNPASAAAQQIKSPEADYVPCRFTYAELKSLSEPEEVITLSSVDADALVSRVVLAIQQEQAENRLSSGNAQKILDEVKPESLVGKSPSEALQSIVKLISGSHEEGKSNAQEPSNSLGAADDVNRAWTSVVDAARITLARISRPPDVGCSMSMLSYTEVSKAFGYIIANNYIAVQIVVRNLNRDEQFVLHDVEYSVNTDPHGAAGRFYSGRDKLVVRALASAEGSFDPRNIVVHGAQGVGALLSTLVPVYGASVGAAAAVYNGGFFPGLDKVWKDLSTDQLNLLNDIGFSSSSTSQTVVPKAGTVMFVTFVPSKQFEHGWWTQECVTATPLGTISKDQSRALIPLTQSLASKQPAPTETISEALEACGFSALHGSQKKSQVQTASSESINESSELISSVPKKQFRKWSGASVALFQELSTVVVAGMHILDESALQPALTSIGDCKDAAGTVIFPVPDNGSLICSLAGKNLSKVKSLRLRNPAESSFIEGAVIPTGGNDATGQVSFKSADLHAANKKDYSVLLVSSATGSIETPTSQVLHLDLGPYVSALDPPKLDLTTLKDPTSFTLSGFHLDEVAEVHFYVSDPSNAVVVKVRPESLPSSQQIKLAPSISDLKKLGDTPTKVKVALVLENSANQVQTPLSVQYTPMKEAAPVGSQTEKTKSPAESKKVKTH